MRAPRREKNAPNFTAKWRFIVILSLFSFSPTWAAESPPVKLEKVRIHVQDRASLLRGAKFFANNCMVCHTMKYMEHNKLAEEAGITLDKMPLKNKEWWLGIVPPDLTLIVSQRGVDWVYTNRSFAL